MYTTVDPLLEAFVGAVRHAERFLGPDDDWVEDDRRAVYEGAQWLFGDLHTFVREKGPADYICTVTADDDEVESALQAKGYQRNLASTRKYRTHHDGGTQWAIGSWVADGIMDDNGLEYQHHVYLFPTESGRIDMYGHREVSASEGAEHLTETDQTHGDPDHMARTACIRAGLTYTRRSIVE